MSETCVTPDYEEELVPNSIIVDEVEDGVCDCDIEAIIGIIYNDQALFDDTFSFL